VPHGQWPIGCLMQTRFPILPRRAVGFALPMVLATEQRRFPEKAGPQYLEPPLRRRPGGSGTHRSGRSTVATEPVLSATIPRSSSIACSREGTGTQRKGSELGSASDELLE